MGRSFVTLMRHAKSSWQNAGQVDHDRPLNARGMNDAPLMAQRLAVRHGIPDLLIASSAQRARQTAACLMDTWQLPASQLQLYPELYLASPDTILDTLANIDRPANHVLLIAHNPGLAQLSTLLAPESSAHMPTSGIRHFSWPENDNDQPPSLIFEDYPKNQPISE